MANIIPCGYNVLCVFLDRYILYYVNRRNSFDYCATNKSFNKKRIPLS